MDIFPVSLAFSYPDLITSANPSNFVSTSYSGQAERQMFDRRIDAFENFNAYLFDVAFIGGLEVEFQVNGEFGSVESAAALVDKYSFLIGQLPVSLIDALDTVWIHDGDFDWGGGNDNILIHEGRFAEFNDLSSVEELIVNLAAINVTTTFGGQYGANDPDWIAAREADQSSPSGFASSNPELFDFQESILAYLAAREYPGRISTEDLLKIEDGLANRFAYIDSIDLDLSVEGQGEAIWSDSDDSFLNINGDNVVDGRDGVDTITYLAVRSGVSQSTQADGSINISLNGREIDNLKNIERIQLDDGAYVYDVEGAFSDLTYSLYAASLARTPDEAGFRFWNDVMNSGFYGHGADAELGLAEAFVEAPEFNDRFDVETDVGFINALYVNVLKREADEPGFQFWLDAFQNGQGRDDMLRFFAVSNENQEIIEEFIDIGYWVI